MWSVGVVFSQVANDDVIPADVDVGPPGFTKADNSDSEALEKEE